MFRKRFLVVSVFSSLVIVGLGACSSAEDRIVDRKIFLKVQARCGEAEVQCVVDVFTLKASEYCASQKLSPADPKCIEIQKKVKQKVEDNFFKNAEDALKE